MCVQATGSGGWPSILPSTSGIVALASGRTSYSDPLPWNEVTAHKERWHEVYADAHSAANFRDWLRMLHDPECSRDVDALFAGSSISTFAGLLTIRYVYFSTPWQTLLAKDRYG